MATWAEPPRRRAGLWALITAMHLALLLPPWLRQHPPAPAAGLRIELRLVAARPAPAPVRPSTALPVTAPAARATSPPTPLDGTAAPSTPAHTETAPDPATEPATEPAAQVDAEHPAPQSLLINTEATRRAVRMVAAGQPLLSERAQAATGLAPRETDQARLGREIQAAATRDCLKGEFLGAGLGLYSLPFWLLAEARGKCRR